MRQPPAGLIVHSDQGSQYTVTRFKDLVAQHGAQQSRRGNCYDNAHVESFWSLFQAELLDCGRFPGLEEAKLEISHHVAYYDATRSSATTHSTISKFNLKLRPNSVRLS